MQDVGRPELNVVRGRVAHWLSERVPIDYRDSLRRQQVGGHPSIAAPGQYDFPVIRIGPIDGRPDLADLVGMNRDGQFAAHVRQHRFPGGNLFRCRGVTLHRGVLGFGISLGFLEEILRGLEPGTAFLGLVFE